MRTKQGILLEPERQSQMAPTGRTQYQLLSQSGHSASPIELTGHIENGGCRHIQNLGRARKHVELLFH